METREEAQAFLAEEGAINRLVSLTKRELQLVLEVLGQEFGPADRKSTLIQLASAAILTNSFSQDIDDEEEEEGAVGGVHEGESVRERGGNYERKREDDVRESEQFIDNAAAQLQLLQLEFEEKDRQRQHEKWLEEQTCRERDRNKGKERVKKGKEKE